MVQRGRMRETRISLTSCSRALWVLSFSVPERAPLAFSMMSLVCFGNAAIEVLGMCIGGEMNSETGSVQLGDEKALAQQALGIISEEFKFPGELSQMFSWMRYVGDIIAFSFKLCFRCRLEHAGPLDNESLGYGGKCFLYSRTNR